MIQQAARPLLILRRGSFGTLIAHAPPPVPQDRACSGYTAHPKMTLYLHGSREPRFRFMLHEVDELGNRVTNKETCNRLSMELPTGSSSISYMVANQDNQVLEVPVEVPANDFSGPRITVISHASNANCTLQVVCVNAQNILGVSGSLSSFPSRVSFVQWAAYFSVTEIAAPRGFQMIDSGPAPQEPLSHEKPMTAQRALTTFDIGLNRAYEITGETTPQPNSSVLLYGPDKIDSWYRFEPQRWPYLQDSLVTVLFSYDSRLLTAIRDSMLFLLAAILGVAFQASIDIFRKKKS